MSRGSNEKNFHLAQNIANYCNRGTNASTQNFTRKVNLSLRFAFETTALN